MIVLFLLSGENTELTSRLQTVRQKAGELEKNLANVTASCEKYEDVSCCGIMYTTAVAVNSLFMHTVIYHNQILCVIYEWKCCLGIRTVNPYCHSMHFFLPFHWPRAHHVICK